MTGLRAAAGQLTGQQRYVLGRRIGEASLAEIGAELGVTESRVCQVMAAVRHRTAAA